MTGTNAIPCMWMRGGTSKGAFFLASDLPGSTGERDRLLLEIMGSPDPRQIDGMGGSDPLTSKVAVVKKSEREGVDVDYLFLQVFVDQAIVSDSQNCGNMLAGVGPFAIERGLQSVEAGAQGEHKLLRGYVPVLTHSAHYIANPALRRAIDDYLEREREYVEAEREQLAEAGPYKRTAT